MTRSSGIGTPLGRRPWAGSSSRHGKMLLLLATTLGGLAVRSQDGFAQTAVAPGDTKTPRRTPAGSESITVNGKSVASADGVTATTSGGGLMGRQTAPASRSTVTRDYIAKQDPTLAPIQLIEHAPGANVASSDPFGLNDSTNITVRGLNQDEIGYLFEGMPIADVDSYAPFSSQWSDTENDQAISLDQGGGAIEDPLFNSAGGVLSVDLVKPDEHPGGLIDYSFGSYKTNREFIRLETGEIGRSGVRGFVSFSNTTYGDWRGSGRGLRRHFDSKLEKDWGLDHVEIVASYNEDNQPFYDNPTLASYRAVGDSYNYGSSFTGPLDGSYWKLNQVSFKNLILSAPSHLALSNRLSVDITPYFYWGSGSGGGGTVIDRTGNTVGTEAVDLPLDVDRRLVQPNGSLLADSVFISSEFHPGLTASVAYRLDEHDTITGGWWFDYTDDHQRDAFVQPGDNGDLPNLYASRIIKFTNGRPFYDGDYHMVTQVNGLFVGDHASFLGDRLHIDAGFKEVMVNRTGTNNLPGPQYAVGYNEAQPVPRVAASYHLTRDDMVFVNAAGNFRVPTISSYFNTYSTDGALIGRGNPQLKSEYSIEEEAGFRHQGEVTFSATFFNYNFSNRNLATLVDFNGVLESGEVNAGGQTVRGIDVELGARPYYGISPYVSGEFLDATIDNNLQAGGDTLPTTGKRAVRSPRWQTSAGLTYDRGGLFGNFLYRWVDQQFSDFMNTEKIPSYGEIDMSVGYRLPDIGYARHPQLRLNLINLANRHYLSGPASISTNAQTVTGIYGTRIAGSAPIYYVAPGFAAMLTVTTGF